MTPLMILAMFLTAVASSLAGLFLAVGFLHFLSTFTRATVSRATRKRHLVILGELGRPEGLKSSDMATVSPVGKWDRSH